MATRSSQPGASSIFGDCTMLPGPFPIPSTKHGTTTIIVTVGEDTDWPTRLFAVHECLLAMASSALLGSCEESVSNGAQMEIGLRNECPMAFEVLYHWLYSGMIYDHTFYDFEEQICYDLFWFEVYNFAGRYNVPYIRKEAFEKLRSRFDGFSGQIPHIDFLERLYHSEIEEVLLQQYIVEHTAFWLAETANTNQWDGWKDSLRHMREAEPHGAYFAEQITFKLAQWSSGNEPSCSRRHPFDDLAYCVCKILACGYDDTTNCVNHHDETEQNYVEQNYVEQDYVEQDYVEPDYMEQSAVAEEADTESFSMVTPTSSSINSTADNNVRYMRPRW